LVAPSTAPLAAPEAAPMRTLPTASVTLVKIAFDERDLPDFCDFFAVLVCAFFEAFFVPALEADFCAPLAGVFFLVVFFVAILILSWSPGLTLAASLVRFFSYPFKGLAVFFDVLKFASFRTTFFFVAFNPLSGPGIVGLRAVLY
jgi:hypothetical protein